MKVTISYWNNLSYPITLEWFWGRHKEIFDLPMCKDGYYHKKPLRAYFHALKGLNGKNIRVEVSDE